MIAFDLRNSILIGNASETFRLEIFCLSNSRLKSQLMNHTASKDASGDTGIRCKIIFFFARMIFFLERAKYITLRNRLFRYSCLIFYACTRQRKRFTKYNTVLSDDFWALETNDKLVTIITDLSSVPLKKIHHTGSCIYIWTNIILSLPSCFIILFSSYWKKMKYYSENYILRYPFPFNFQYFFLFNFLKKKKKRNECTQS